MAVVDVDAVPGTGSARRRLLRIGVRLALTAGFAVVGWLLCGLAASAASASELPQASSVLTSAPVPGDNGGDLLGGLLDNTVGSVTSTVTSVLDTVHSTLDTTLGAVNNTVTSVVGTVGTGVVKPAVTTVTTTVAPLVPTSQPATNQSAPSQPGATQTPAATANPLPAQPSPAPAAAPLVKPAHHSAPKSAPANTTMPVEQLRPEPPSVPLPKTPQPAPQQPLAPAPTISTGHGPNGGNKHAVHAVVTSAGGVALAQLTTVASHPVVIPGDMPGLPSVSPD